MYPGPKRATPAAGLAPDHTHIHPTRVPALGVCRPRGPLPRPSPRPSPRPAVRPMASNPSTGPGPATPQAPAMGASRGCFSHRACFGYRASHPSPLGHQASSWCPRRGGELQVACAPGCRPRQLAACSLGCVCCLLAAGPGCMAPQQVVNLKRRGVLWQYLVRPTPRSWVTPRRQTCCHPF